MTHKTLAISILAFLINAAVLPTAMARETTLQDGFVLDGVDGKLTAADANSPDKWFFQFDSDLSDDQGLLKAGSAIELLPSSAMEKIIDNLKDHPDATYSLWGTVTKYKGRNFIFVSYFLPITKTTRPEPSTTPQQKNAVTINEPNDELPIPQEIIAKLRTRRIIRPVKIQKKLQLKTDYILADRTGFIADQPDGSAVLVFDALGRNIQKLSFILLPCRALERAQRKQSAELETLNFKIAGIVTNYKGKNYLLLQRAVPARSHGNFGGLQ